MASRKEERAEGAARYAADEIKSAREDRQAQQQAQHQAQQRHKEYQQHGFTEDTHQQQTKPGIISSVVGALGSTYEHAKEAVTGKTHDAAEKTKDAAAATSEKMKESHDTAAIRAKEAADRAREGRDNTAESLRQTKDYTAEKTKDAAGYVADKAKQAKDTTMEKAGEARDYTADKAKQAKDATAEKAAQARDYTAEKARQAADKTEEMKDYTVEKTREGKDASVSRLGELKDSAADVAKKAMGFLSGKKDEAAEAAKEKGREAMDFVKDTEGTQDVYKDTEDKARRRMEEMRLEKLREKGYDVQDEAAERARADREAAALRGEAGKNNILGAMGNVVDAVKSKLTMPSDMVEDKRRAQGRSGEDKTVTVTVEESPPGAAADLLKNADLLKTADQITGQSFTPNDVGRMGEEGTGKPARRR